MEKVKLTKVQAEALEYALLSRGKDYVVSKHVNCIESNFNEHKWVGKAEALNDLLLDTIIRAIYIGYEVERTPEEQVKEYYDELIGKCDRHAVQCTLDILGIKIEGINT